MAEKTDAEAMRANRGLPIFQATACSIRPSRTRSAR
jgi:hypothetical protein